MPLRALRSWLLAGWLLSLGGCASSEEGHGHEHGGHEHASHEHEGSHLEEAVHALQARMKADHGRVHEELDHAAADQKAWEAKRPGDPALAEHRQVLVGLKGVLERQHAIGHDVEDLHTELERGGGDAAKQEARLKALDARHTESMGDLAKLHDEHERLAHQLDGAK